MTNMDVLLILGIVAFLAMYAAWMWDEVKKATPNPYDSEESQNKGAQAHEMTSDEEKYQATKQKRSRRQENEPQGTNYHRN